MTYRIVVILASFDVSCGFDNSSFLAFGNLVAEFINEGSRRVCDWAY